MISVRVRKRVGTIALVNRNNFFLVKFSRSPATATKLYRWVGAPSGRLLYSLLLVESFRGDVGAVRSHNRAPIEEKPPKVIQIPQWFEDGTVQPLTKVNGFFGVIVEGQVNPIAVFAQRIRPGQINLVG